MRTVVFLCAVTVYKDSSLTTKVCVLWNLSVDRWGSGQMAPGWVRISQLHMKEQRPWVGKLKERLRDCVADEGRGLTCFDHRIHDHARKHVDSAASKFVSFL